MLPSQGGRYPTEIVYLQEEYQCGRGRTGIQETVLQQVLSSIPGITGIREYFNLISYWIKVGKLLECSIVFCVHGVESNEGLYTHQISTNSQLPKGLGRVVLDFGRNSGTKIAMDYSFCIRWTKIVYLGTVTYFRRWWPKWPRQRADRIRNLLNQTGMELAWKMEHFMEFGLVYVEMH